MVVIRRDTAVVVVEWWIGMRRWKGNGSNVNRGGSADIGTCREKCKGNSAEKERRKKESVVKEENTM